MIQTMTLNSSSEQRESLAAFFQLLCLRDRETGVHSLTVAGIARDIARSLQLPALMVDEVIITALLHDIGKIEIPDAILNKSSKLNEAEWALMRQHPALGEQIIGTDPSLHRFATGVRHHHERWDGRGYPDGLLGDAIPLVARIIAVADSFAVITTARPYQAERSVAEALRELHRCAGTQFDAAIVRAFAATQMRCGAVPAQAA